MRRFGRDTGQTSDGALVPMKSVEQDRLDVPEMLRHRGTRSVSVACSHRIVYPTMVDGRLRAPQRAVLDRLAAVAGCEIREMIVQHDEGLIALSLRESLMD